MTQEACDCAERSHAGFVFTCRVCVGAVIESSGYRVLRELHESVKVDIPGSVSASEEEEEVRLG